MKPLSVSTRNRPESRRLHVEMRDSGVESLQSRWHPAMVENVAAFVPSFFGPRRIPGSLNRYSFEAQKVMGQAGWHCKVGSWLLMDAIKGGRSEGFPRTR